MILRGCATMSRKRIFSSSFGSARCACSRPVARESASHDLPLDKVIVTVNEHGNTSAASIPLALDVAVREGHLQRGQRIVLEGVGGGFTWGAALIDF